MFFIGDVYSSVFVPQWLWSTRPGISCQVTSQQDTQHAASRAVEAMSQLDEIILWKDINNAWNQWQDSHPPADFQEMKQAAFRLRWFYVACRRYPGLKAMALPSWQSESSNPEKCTTPIDMTSVHFPANVGKDGQLKKNHWAECRTNSIPCTNI